MTGTTAAVDHNGYARGNRYFMSNYSRGLTVLDITNPSEPVQAGYFDTYTPHDSAYFTGAWGVFPFLPSGNLLVSDIVGGLYVLGDRTRVSEHGKIGFKAASFGGEEGNDVSVSVVRTDGTSGSISVDYAVIPGSASSTDLTASTGTLEWADDDDSERNITVPLLVDGVSEPVERALVRLSNPTGGAVLADTSMASVFIGDPGGSTTVGFAETNIAVEETATRVIATVNRMGSPSGAASVTYAAHPGTATAGNDYRPPAGNQLSWIDGDATPRTIVIPIIHDQADEVREQFELRLSAPSGATLADAHTLTVEVNADVPGLTLSKTAVTMTEGDGESYSVVLDTRPSGNVTVTVTVTHYQIGDADIQVSSSDLTFGTVDWSTPQTVTITSTEDSDAADDIANITHSASGGGYDSVTTDLTVTVTDSSPPGKVSGVVANEAVESLVVSWNAVDGADGYKVQRKSGRQSYNSSDRQHTVSGGSVTTYTIPNLAAGTQFTVRVIATKVNTADGSPSADRTGTPRASAPDQVSGVVVTEAVESLKVAWSAVGGASGYNVQWKSGPTYNTGDRQHFVPGGTITTHTIPNLTAGIPHTVRVTATKANAADGPPSSDHAGTPRAPALDQVSGLVVTEAVESLIVAWSAVAGASGYNVQWKSGGQAFDTGDRQHLVTVGAVTTHTIPNLTAGIQYTVRVTATKLNAADGPPSSDQTGAPKAQMPGQVSQVTLTEEVKSLTASWDPVSGADGYKVQWKSNGQAYNTDNRQHVVSGGFISRYTISNLAAGIQYAVQVKATKANAEDGPPSPESMGTPRAQAPEQVSRVTLTEQAESLAVSWNQMSGADGYKVQWKSGGEAYNTGDRQHVVSSNSITNYTIQNLTAGTQYTVQVSATKAHAADGPPSLERSGTPKTAIQGSSQELDTVVVAGHQLVLTFDRLLDENSVPAPVDFAVLVENSERAGVTKVVVRGKTVTLTLRRLVAHGERVRVSYTPGTNPLRTEARVAVAAIAGEAAVETVVSVASGNAAEGEVVTFVVTLSRAVAERLTADWIATDGSARAGADFAANQGGSLTVPTGKTSGTIEVATLEDTAVEGDGDVLSDAAQTTKLSSLGNVERGGGDRDDHR